MPVSAESLPRVAIFDLDGTLLDTLDDLADAVNQALVRAHFPARSRDEIRAFVGNGVRLLVCRAVPAGTDAATVEAVLADFLAIYSGLFAGGDRVKTAPYPGILPLLDELRERGVKIAVVSNKFDGATKALCARFFGDRVDVAIGEREADGIRKKPAPDTVFEALDTLGLRGACRATYIGDSDVDIETAENAAMPCISATWGFRDRDFLVSHGARVLADTPDEVLQLLTEC